MWRPSRDWSEPPVRWLRWAPKLRVNAVSPGLIETPMTAREASEEVAQDLAGEVVRADR